MTTLVVGQHWHETRNESALVSRSIAAAASRVGPVSVWAPGSYRTRTPDGLFDVTGFGDTENFRLPESLDRDTMIVVDELTEEIATGLTAGDRAPGFYLSAPTGTTAPSWRQLQIVVPVQDQTSRYRIRPHIPINPLAGLHRHNGFGFTGYLLVLAGASTATPEEVAWLSAAFHDANVVVIAQSVASAWRGRALRGEVSVDTQMDFWRLMAHACACIDLEPGPLIARECVEALRFGTPIVVPEQSGPAAAHAGAGGGFTFADASELIEAVARMQNSHERSIVAGRGRHYADATYGDPASLVADFRRLSEG